MFPFFAFAERNSTLKIEQVTPRTLRVKISGIVHQLRSNFAIIICDVSYVVGIFWGFYCVPDKTRHIHIAGNIACVVDIADGVISSISISQNTADARFAFNSTIVMAIPNLFSVAACITDYAADEILSGDSRCAGAVKDSSSAFACDTADSVARAGDGHTRPDSTICYVIIIFMTSGLITAEQTTDVIFSTHDSIFNLYIIGRQAAFIIAGIAVA